MAALETVDDSVALGSQALADAIEQQAATAEVLRIISRSPADAQPVFDTIAAAALKLCAARSVNVLTYDGAVLHIAALATVVAHGIDAMRNVFPRPASRDSAAGRAVLTRSTAIISDVMADPEYMIRQAAVTAGFRSIIGVPLLRGGEPIGAIAVGRAEPGPFPPAQIVLLQTFAEQAAMAIENMRLFAERETRNRELAEALEHQTATSDILRVLSRMPNEVQPVFDAIVNAGVRLFEGAAVAISRHEGGLVRSVAIAEEDPVRAARWRKVFPFPLSRDYIHGAAILDCRVVDVADVQVVGGQFEAGKRNLAPSGYRAMTVVPLVRDGTAIGAIAVVRMTPGPLSPKQIALLQTFADQAVIAIENVRLFNETKEALARQTATSDVLRVISGSVTDTQPVFDVIAERAARLTGADYGMVFSFDGEWIQVASTFGVNADGVAAVRKAFPMRPGLGSVTARAVRDAAVVNVADVMALPDTEYLTHSVARSTGYHGLLSVPMLRDSQVVGAITVMHPQVGEFVANEVALLQTFAQQAVIAIENARLFREIEAKSRELEIASGHKSAFLANMSHELRTPLNAIIGFTRIVMRRTRAQIEAKQLQNLENILASAQHLLSLINAALDLAKIEAGRIEVHASEIALAPLLDDCVRSVEPLLGEGVRLGLQAGSELPPMQVDEEKLRQIVINLLSNAAKFTARGRIDVGARCIDGRVEISVADTGIGIPADRLEAVFEEFEQVDASSTRAHGGTGLGLAIARRLAQLMGGELRAQTALGVGSTFTLSLPLHYRPPAP